jgi:hypothetical protein
MIVQMFLMAIERPQRARRVPRALDRAAFGPQGGAGRGRAQGEGEGEGARQHEAEGAARSSSTRGARSACARDRKVPPRTTGA